MSLNRHGHRTFRRFPRTGLTGSQPVMVCCVLTQPESKLVSVVDRNGVRYCSLLAAFVGRAEVSHRGSVRENRDLTTVLAARSLTTPSVANWKRLRLSQTGWPVHLITTDLWAHPHESLRPHGDGRPHNGCRRIRVRPRSQESRGHTRLARRRTRSEVSLPQSTRQRGRA